MRRTILLSLALFLIAVTSIGCGNNASAGKPTGPTGLPVKVVAAQAQMVPQVTEYLATMKSRNAAILQPQVEGDITRIFVHSGERVEAGAAILQIDPRKQQATVNNQEAGYKSKTATMELARTDLERKKKLYAAGVIAKAELDQAQSAFDASKADAEAQEAGIREQKVQLRYYTVNAPTAGIIGDIPVRIGDHVTNQTQLTTMDQSGQLEAYIYIPAEKSRELHAGMAVDLLDDAGQPMQRTHVSFVSPRVDSDSQTLLVKAPVQSTNMKFRNAQQVHARVVWSERKLAMIPVTAVSRLSGKLFAFVAEGTGQQAVAKQRVIQVGDLIGNDYSVLDGIQPGDQIIVSGIQMLADGMPVIPHP